MKNRYLHHLNRFFASPDDERGHDHPRGRHGRHRHAGDPPGPEHHHGHRRHKGGRLFDYGELRFLLLAMIAERPRHGYELIKAIEERFGGSYTPSPGVIYPTLAWLDDMGYAAIDAGQPSRKCYRITPEGEVFLAANKPAVDSTLIRAATGGPSDHAPAPLVRAMENLKLALRLRHKRGPISEESAAVIAAAIDAAAQTVERSQ